MFKAIIFDFDGVIVLSEEPRFKALQKSAARFGVTLPDNSFGKMHGKTTLNYLKEYLSDSEKLLMDKIIDEYETTYKKNIAKYVTPIEHTVDFIKNYRGPLQFALATGSSRKVIEELTGNFGIYEKFTSLTCKEDVNNHKPDPETYLKTARALGVKPTECVVIEDSVVGVQSALNAHMKCYVLLNGFNKKSLFDSLPIAGFINNLRDMKNFQ